MTDIRKPAKKAKLTPTKDKQYLNILKKLTVFIVVKNVSNVVAWDIL